MAEFSMMSRHMFREQRGAVAAARAFALRSPSSRYSYYVDSGPMPCNNNVTIATFRAASIIITHQRRYKTGRGSSSPRPPKNFAPHHAKKTDLSGVKHQVEHRAKETIGIRLTERVVERVAEAAEQGVERAAAAKTLAKVAERAAVKPLAKQAAARTAERAAKQAAVRTAGRAARRSTKKAATAAAAATTTAKTLPRVPRSFFGVLSPTGNIVARVGRGCLIAVPLAGAGFAAWIGWSDYRRTRRELELARVRLTRALEEHCSATAVEKKGEVVPPVPTLDTSTVLCFGVAAAADSVNVVAHLVAAYGLYQGWLPDDIVNAEMASWISAVVSTGTAVRGEYLAARRSSNSGSEELDGEKHGAGGTGSGDVERVVRDGVSAEEPEEEKEDGEEQTEEEERHESLNDPQDGTMR